MDEETERKHVRACIKAIQSVSLTEKAPVGWYTGRVGPNSRRIVWEEYKKVVFIFISKLECLIHILSSSVFR